MEEQQPREEAGTGQDPLVLDREHFAQELQELGLLEFANEVNFSRLTDAQGEATLPTPRQPGSAGPVAHNIPPPQPTQAFDIQQCQYANQASDIATARALHVLHLAKVSLHQLITSYNPRAAGSGGTDGSSKRRKTSRGADASGSRSGSKGLRHFSMKVCEKVEAKGRTTYNEVADDLVREMSQAEAANKSGQFDEKNIRRRVYDAINVLMAMEIIQKEKKEITWKGFPRLSNHSLEKLKADRLARVKEVEQKQLYLQDMIEQQTALKRLLERSAGRGPNPSGTQLFLPFILVQAKPDATVEVKISEDMMDVQFDFYHSPFQIHDDSHVLKKMAEHLARQQQQQQQQQAFANPLAGGLTLPWQQPNGAASSLVAAALSPMSDPALAHLAVAAAQAQAQAQAQGSALAYGYPPAAAAAAAAFYQHHQQQQQLLQQHQQQQQQQQQGQQQQQQHAQLGQQGLLGGQQQQGSQQQQQQGQAQQQGATAAAQQGQQQQQQAGVQQQQQGQLPQQGQHGQLPGQLPSPSPTGPLPVSQLHQQQQQQALQLQTIQALQAQLQHQQLQAHLQQARTLPGGLSLPPLPPPLGHAPGLQGGPHMAALQPAFGLSASLTGAVPPQHIQQAAQLAGKLAAAPPGVVSASGGLLPPPPPQPQQHLGLPQLPSPQLGPLLPLPPLPANLAAVLAPPPHLAQAMMAPPPPPGLVQAAPSAAAGGTTAQAGVAPPPPVSQPIGLQQLPPLGAPAPAAAFPLVA